MSLVTPLVVSNGEYKQASSTDVFANPTVSTQVQPANPSGTSSLVGVMMGIGSVATITTVRSTKVMVVISGGANSSVNSRGGRIQIRSGIGAAPANGTALSGTAQGNSTPFLNNNNAEIVPFSVNAVISGLTIGVANWIDLSVLAVTSGTVSLSNLSVSIFEI